VRPSSGAETLEKDAACEMSDTLVRAGTAAAEDARTSVNRHPPAQLHGIDDWFRFDPESLPDRSLLRPGRPHSEKWSRQAKVFTGLTATRE